MDTVKTEVFEGVFAGMHSASWLDRTGLPAVPLVWRAPYVLVTRPLRVLDHAGRLVVRAGDRIAVTGVMLDGELVIDNPPTILTRATSRGFFDLSAEQRARARARGRRRLAVMMVLTAVIAVGFGLILVRDSQGADAGVVIGGVCVGLAAAWSGLIIGFWRQQSDPLPYDGLDTAGRRDVRRAMWRGTAPALENADAFLLTVSRASWSRWFNLAFSAYLTSQFFLYATDASDRLEQTVLLACAVVMALAFLMTGWQSVAIRRSKQALASATYARPILSRGIDHS